jgi:hypothetical protein
MLGGLKMSDTEKMIARIRMNNSYYLNSYKRIKYVEDKLVYIRMALNALNLQDAVQLVDKIDSILIAEKEKIKEHLKMQIPADLVNNIITDFLEKSKEE